MKQRKLGHTDISISQMGFGNCDFGTKISEERAFKVLDAFYEAGGNFIDTSNNYSIWNPGGKGGECETIIGNWMKSRGVRDQIVLATKVGANHHNRSSLEKEDGNLVDDWYLRGEGLSREAITQAIEGSLNRLQTDRIDLYYAHVEDTEVEIFETLETFDTLHKEGKIRAIGCSNHPTWKLDRAKEISRQNNFIEYCCTQDLHTYLKPLASKRSLFATDEKLDYLRRYPETTLIAYTPTLWGKFAQKDNYQSTEFWGEFYTPDTKQRLKTLSQIASNRGISEIQLVYAWMMQSTPSAVPLIATGSVEHLQENVAALNVELAPEEIEQLDNAGC